MAARRFRSSRSALVALAAGSALLATPALALAYPAPSSSVGASSAARLAATVRADHTTHTKSRADKHQSIAQVQRELGKLVMQNSEVVERYDRAHLLVVSRTASAQSAQRAAIAAENAYSSASSDFSQVLQAQYESGSDSLAGGALLTSNSGSGYLDQMSTMDLVSSREAQVLADVQSTRRAAAQASQHAATLLAAARTQQKALAVQKNAVTAQIASYRKLLATLNSAQQADYLRAADPSLSAAKLAKLDIAAPNAAARAAVEFALHQVGKPYVWGSAGPSTFDCSGLTMASWARGGVSLPHSAAEQYNYGTHVSRNDLEPGDLIFFYHPIGHVTIYIGDGYMVSAPETGEDVSVVPLSAFNSDYAGATRLH